MLVLQHCTVCGSGLEGKGKGKGHDFPGFSFKSASPWLVSSAPSPHSPATAGLAIIKWISQWCCCLGSGAWGVSFFNREGAEAEQISGIAVALIVSQKQKKNNKLGLGRGSGVGGCSRWGHWGHCPAHSPQPAAQELAEDVYMFRSALLKAET